MLFLYSVTFADIAPLGSRGGNVFPINNPDVEMIKEEVYINCFKDSLIATAKFWLTSEKAVKNISIGFPAQVYAKGFYEPSIPIWKFSAFVDNKECTTSLRKSKLSRNNINHWFQWLLSINKGDTVEIEVNYTGAVTWYSRLSFAFLIGTGKYWKGNIGNGKIIFNNSQVGSILLHENYSVYYDYRTHKKPNIKKTYFENSLVYKFKNYQPDNEELVASSIFKYWNNKQKFSNLDSLLQDSTTYYKFRYECKEFIERKISFLTTYSKSLTNEETQALSVIEIMISKLDSYFLKNKIMNISDQYLILLKTEILARNGHLFNDNLLMHYYDTKSWYNKVEVIDHSKLNDYENIIINFIDNRITNSNFKGIFF